MCRVNCLNSRANAVILSSCRFKANAGGLDLQLLHEMMGRPKVFWKLALFDDGCSWEIDCSSYPLCRSCATPAKRELGN